MAKERRTRKADRPKEWAVVVRLADGSVLYWCGEEAKRRGQDWAPHHRQAHRFATLEEAERHAASCSTNAQAREYKVVPLPARLGLPRQ